MPFQLNTGDFQIGRRGSLRRGGGGDYVPAPPSMHKRYIWDTDNDSDCDDVAALAVLLRLLQKHGGELIASTAASNNVYAAPALDVLLDYGGHAGVPVGAYKGSAIGGGNSSKYTQPVVQRFHANTAATRADYPDAVPLLRTALRDAPDGTVRIICGGTLTNLAALLQSPGDAIDPRTGVQLVAAKVERMDVMGGNFVTASTVENNVLYDVPAANVVASLTPVPVYWAGWEVGNPIQTTILDAAPATVDPYRYAWELYFTPAGGDRASWDLIPVWTSIAGPTTLFGYSAPGNVVYSPESYTTFTADAAGKNRYITKVATDDAIRRALNGAILEFVSARAPAPASPVAPANLIYEFLLEGGDLQAIPDSGPNNLQAFGGNATTVDASDPVWTPQGLKFEGGDYALVPFNAVMNVTDTVVVAVVKMTSQTGDHMIVARDNGGTAGSFQFRTSGGIFQWIGRGSLTTTISDNTDPVPVDQYVLLVGKVNDRRARLYKNGALVGGATLQAAMPTTLAIPTYIGARQASSVSNRMVGEIVYVAQYGSNPDEALPAIMQRARDRAALKGVVV